MFLTRLGFNSKIVITGDITQIDLPTDKKSGLKEAMRILKDIEDISIYQLSYKDVVRHVLVQKIIRAYESHEEAYNKRMETNNKARIMRVKRPYGKS
jgi:phosphate starvation-inducible PhoH-like protein